MKHPMTQAQRRLLAIWRDVLAREEAGLPLTPAQEQLRLMMTRTPRRRPDEDDE